MLVAANGFFVAAEFSMVAVRRSRVTERRMNTAALQWVVVNLVVDLVATQLRITISSLALGWIGESALAIPGLHKFVAANSGRHVSRKRHNRSR